MNLRALSMRVSLSALVACSIANSAIAEEVIVNGKHFSKQGDKMYPMVDSSWTDISGKRHELWLTDYSSYQAPDVHPNFKEQHPNFKEQNPDFSEKSSLLVRNVDKNISVDDRGCKHKVSIGADALFDFDKSDLTPAAESTLQKVLPVLVTYGAHPISIEGHTDSIGADEYNNGLSERRAETVKGWLVAHNYVSPSISTLGFGKTHPVNPNTYNDGTDFPQGRQKNRRVEIIVDTCQ